MARIVITGSTQGLGYLSAQWLLDRGHEVVLHARHEGRRAAITDLVTRGCDVVVGDLGNRQETQDLATQINSLGSFDAVIHNAGVVSGPDMVEVNLIAPYVLTALITRPQRLIYLSSNDHFWGEYTVESLGFTGKPATASYADTKLAITTLAMAIARRWPNTITSAVDPGWVPTNMGGPHAPDDLHQGAITQAWLGVGEESGAIETGHYWYHQRPRQPHHDTQDEDRHTQLLEALAQTTGITLP